MAFLEINFATWTNRMTEGNEWLMEGNTCSAELERVVTGCLLLVYWRGGEGEGEGGGGVWEVMTSYSVSIQLLSEMCTYNISKHGMMRNESGQF